MARSLQMLVALGVSAGLASTGVAQTSDPVRIRAAVDSMVGAALTGGRAAGMSVGVVRGTDTLVLKAYGSADLELDVPTPERAIYEIGSVTKQFTSASILLLVERGKLSLDDALTKYLPDYPTQGNTVTIRRLLDHTSGIAGYTEMRAFGPLIPLRLPRDTLVKLFSREPFKFKPGEALAYNNSAYFLLGLVIEKVTGGTYGDFVKTNLFDKAGMVDSRYCSERDITKRRAHGYEFGQGGLAVKSPLSHAWPYAAGSLCSTAWDLMAWSRALHGGKILTPASYRLQTTPTKLNDGTPVRYAMGLINDSIGGRHAIYHGGGINGFLTAMAYFPDDQLTIAVLVNSTGPVSPDAVLNSIADVIHGRPATPAPVALEHPASDYVGTYRGAGRGDSLNVAVITDSTGVRFRLGNAPQPGPAARYVGGDTFMMGRNRFTFVREGGKVSAIRADLISVVTKLVRTP
ncbi:MAG TPA: serine hydrolase domain-containing protein [Gemmatimonadaceae bacterium]